MKAGTRTLDPRIKNQRLLDKNTTTCRHVTSRVAARASILPNELPTQRKLLATGQKNALPVLVFLAGNCSATFWCDRSCHAPIDTTDWKSVVLERSVRARYQLLADLVKTVLPSLIVSRTTMSLIVVDSTLSGFLSRITKSASLPASSVPLEASSFSW